MTHSKSRRDFPAADADFASTRWSIVLAAGQPSAPDARDALATLCQDYWYPLYAYVRRRVRDPNQAQDVIQEFFGRLLEKNLLVVADPKRGRFRSFLLTSLRHFLADQWDKTQAQKRGGGGELLSLDFETGESRYTLHPVDEMTPERLYDRQWAITLLDHVSLHLRQEYARAGKAEHFDQLRVFLAGRSPDHSYANAARQLNMSEGAAMVAAHRLRRRYRDLLRAEIAKTVSGPDDVDDEIRNLFASLGP